MAQKVRRRGVATEVDVFNKQIGSDDGFFSWCAAQDGSVITNTCNKRMSRKSGALPKSIDEIEFAFGRTVVVGTLFLFVSHPQGFGSKSGN